MGGLTDTSSYNLSPSNYESESDRIKRILASIESEEQGLLDAEVEAIAPVRGRGRRELEADARDLMQIPNTMGGRSTSGLNGTGNNGADLPQIISEVLNPEPTPTEIINEQINPISSRSEIIREVLRPSPEVTLEDVEPVVVRPSYSGKGGVIDEGGVVAPDPFTPVEGPADETPSFDIVSEEPPIMIVPPVSPEVGVEPPIDISNDTPSSEPLPRPAYTPPPPVEVNWNGNEGGGGYNPNDYAFDRYIPGEESPWGAPDISGGNKEFYRNQFMNLLSDEQNFRDRQRQASDIRDNAPPLQNPGPDWSWVDGGLPEVVVMDSGYAQPIEGLNRPVTPDSPNYGGYGNIFGGNVMGFGSGYGGNVGSGSGSTQALINTSKK